MSIASVTVMNVNMKRFFDKKKGQFIVNFVRKHLMHYVNIDRIFRVVS